MFQWLTLFTEIFVSGQRPSPARSLISLVHLFACSFILKTKHSLRPVLSQALCQVLEKQRWARCSPCAVELRDLDLQWE